MSVNNASRVNICGVMIDNLSLDEAVEEVMRSVDRKESSFVVTCNADHIVKVERDAEFAQIYKAASLVVADGVPLLWASAFFGTPLKGRVNGTDLFERLCEASAQTGRRLFFLGGRPGAASRAAEVLKNRHPDIRIAGVYSPRAGFELDREENDRITGMIRDAGTDILFVGLGAPKQEKWIFNHREECRVSVSIGIGVSFELVAGVVARAPAWMQRSGLEWLWRLIMEPARLWKRYLVDDMGFFRLVLKQKFSK